MKHLFFVTLCLLACFGCKPKVIPEAEEKVLMLAIINRPPGYPKDFETDLIKGNYYPDSNLLRIDGHDPFSRDRLKITLESTGVDVLGTYPIGDFSLPETRVKAQYISEDVTLDVRSLGGSLTITKFESTEDPKILLMDGTFSFTGMGDRGDIEVSNGEILRVEVAVQ